MKHTLTSFGGNTQISIVSPFARRILWIFGILSSAYVLIVFAIDDCLSFFWGPLLVLIGLFSLYIYTKPQRRYYSPLVLTIFYFLGYLISFADILLNKSDAPVSGFMSIGLFGFTDDEFLKVVLAIFVGMSGILFATFSAERIFKRFHVVSVKRDAQTFFIKAKSLQNWAWIWFTSSVSLIFLMYYLEIGRIGLKGSTTLPFKLVGTFFFFRNVVVPFGGLLLLGLSLNADKKGLTKLLLWMLILVGALGSIAGISRGYFVFTISPALFFMLLTSYKSGWNRKMLFRFIFVAFIMVLVLVVLVQNLRNAGYATGDLSIYESYRVLTARSDFDLLKAISTFFSLATARIGGMRELLAGVSSGVNDLYAPWAIFITDSVYLQGLLLSVFGFLPSTSDTHAFGVGFGLWGMFTLSGSYMVIFIGTVASCLIVICVEELFIRKGRYSVACFFATYLCMQIWGNIYLFILVRNAIMIAICYVIMNRVLKSSRYKTKQMLYHSEVTNVSS